MATRPRSGEDPAQRVRTTDRLWSAEVGAAEAQAGVQPYPTNYQWSNGREFIERTPAHSRDDDGNQHP